MSEALDKAKELRSGGLFNHNRARGQARDGATEGRPEGRDERDRASQIGRMFTNGERLQRRISLSVVFVFFREIRGSNVCRLDIRASQSEPTRYPASEDSLTIAASNRSIAMRKKTIAREIKIQCRSRQALDIHGEFISGEV